MPPPDRGAPDVGASSGDADLLVAAFGSGAEARAAWRRWQGPFRWESALEAPVYRLLPFLHRNLARLGVEDPVLPRLKGVRRQSWARNQAAWAALGSLRRELQHARVRFVLGSPGPLLAVEPTAILAGESWWLLVPREQMVAASAAFRRDGRRPIGGIPRWCAAGYVIAAGSLEWQRDDGRGPAIRLGATDGRVPALERRLFGRPVPVLDPAAALEHLAGAPPPTGILETAMPLLPLLEWSEDPSAAPAVRRWHRGWSTALGSLARLLPHHPVSRWATGATEERRHDRSATRPTVTPSGWRRYLGAPGLSPPWRALRHVPGYVLGRLVVSRRQRVGRGAESP